MSSLLKLLKSHSCFEYLPSDARSFLKTPRVAPILTVDPGQYCHLGLQSQILSVFPSTPNFQTLTLQISVDGIPISKSTDKQVQFF